MFSQFLSHIMTENQKNTTVTDQNTISLSLSDESKSTALCDSVDNSPQVLSTSPPHLVVVAAIASSKKEPGRRRSGVTEWRRRLKKLDGCGLGVNSGGLDFVNGSLARWWRLNKLTCGVLGWWWRLNKLTCGVLGWWDPN
uniref:Uncharacterized protein n=1 Tax=Brassica oleracea var. oleracea TaxID=109376 RepID=A0A0D3AQ52_BRAOL